MKQQNKNKKWTKFFNDDFIQKVYQTKKEVSKSNKKRTIICTIIIWTVWLILLLPVLFSGKNWAGEEIEITPLWIATDLLVPSLVCITFLIIFNFNNTPRDFVEEAEGIIREQLILMNKREYIDEVITEFKVEEKVSPEIISKRFIKCVCTIIVIVLASIITTIIIFH